MKHEQEKSDPSTVAKRPANKPGQLGAESAEPREGTEGNTREQHTCRTPSWESVSQGLERVREAAKQRKKERFTALLHHVTIDLLKDAYSWLKREAAPGVDGRTWQSYKQNLEVNLAELHPRLHQGTYRALPSRRRYILKPDGGNARWGSPALEDKIAQRAVVVAICLSRCFLMAE
jgi:RNA-directed DNA polymerase